MKQRKKRFALYTIGLLFALHYALPTYVISSFLENLWSEQSVGIIYTLASLLTIVVFLAIPRSLKSAGDYRFTMQLLLLDLLAVMALAYNPGALVGTIAVMIHLLVVPIIYFNLDILLESYSTRQDTGGIRGVYLSLVNIGWVLAPLIASLLLHESERYYLVFALSSIMLFPIILIFRHRFQDFEDPPYKEIEIARTLRHIITNKNTRHIFWSAFFLQFFFAWMVIYSPIYMHNHIGMPWNEIGLVLSIALLPYVFIEAPLGRLADTRFGEKEILTLGFVISGAATIALAFITSGNIMLWAGILFATRVGAAMVEIMTETYFFKIKEESDADVLSFFRIIRPGAYVIGPIVATMLLTTVSFQTLFVILGCIMLYAMRHSLAIKDTK